MSTFHNAVFMIFANSNNSHIDALFAPSVWWHVFFIYLFFNLLFSVQLMTTCDLTAVGDILWSLPVEWRYKRWYDWVLLWRTARLPPTAAPPTFWVPPGNVHTYISIYWYYSGRNTNGFMWIMHRNDSNVWECAPPAPGMSDEGRGRRSQALTSVLFCLRHCNTQKHTRIHAKPPTLL